MKPKYKNLQLLIYFSKIQKNMFKKKEEKNKSIMPYIPLKKSIVVYRPPIV